MQTILFRQGTISFDEGGNGLKSKAAPIELMLDAGSTIHDATVFLRGYDVFFTNGDHNFQQLSVNLAFHVSDDRKNLSVSANLLLRDSNGDDSFVGYIDYSVVVIIEYVPQVFFPINTGSFMDHLKGTFND